MIEGVDYAFSNPSETGLAAAGKTFAMRYVGPGSAPKHLTAAERDRIWAAGLSIVLLAEGATNDAIGGYNMGVKHGQLAKDAAVALGAPSNTPIYAAVDWDVTAAQWATVAQYLRGFAFEVGTPQVGIYGSVRAMQWAARDKVASWFFQTYAWSYGAWYPGNHVEQYHNGATLAGGTVDLCRAKVSNFGQWTRSGAGPTTIGDDMDITQSNKLDAVFNLYDTVPLDTNNDGKAEGAFPVPLTRLLKGLAADVAVLKARPEVAAVQVDAAAVAAALAGNTAFLASLAKAVNDDAARRLAS